MKTDTSVKGYQKRNKGGQKVYEIRFNEESGTFGYHDHLYDFKNTLLSKDGFVWVVSQYWSHILDSIWESYGKAFDRAKEIEGCIERVRIQDGH